MSGKSEPVAGRPRVVVVGPCGSGKSTLATALKEQGVNVRVSGQEHSSVRDLWRKLDPDILVALDVALDIVRQRRSPTWPEDLYVRQHQRLQRAYDEATVVIDTGAVPASEMVAKVLETVNAWAAS